MRYIYVLLFVILCCTSCRNRLLEVLRENKFDEAKSLIKSGADVNYREGLYCDTPLFIAVTKKQVDIVRLLIEAGANVNAEDCFGRTAIWYTSNKEIENVLKEAGTDGWTPLIIAAYEGKEEEAESLIKSGVNLNTEMRDGKTSLTIRAPSTMGNPKIRNALRKAGADGWTPLMIAAMEMDLLRVQKLVANKVDVNAKTRKGDTALDIINVLPYSKADKQTHQQIRTILKKAGAAGWNPLMISSEEGNIIETEKLISSGTDIDACNIYGMTALMIAILYDNQQIAKILIDAGAKVNINYGYIYTPLMIAANKGNDKIVRYLIDAGANINAKNQDEETAYRCALKVYNYSTADILERAGANTKKDGR